MYYLLEIDRFNDGSEEAKAIYEKTDFDDALLSLYSTMSFAMQNPKIDNILCMILNREGFTERREYWENRPE